MTSHQNSLGPVLVSPRSQGHDTSQVATNDGSIFDNLELPLRSGLCEKAALSVGYKIPVKDFGLQPIVDVHESTYVDFLRATSSALAPTVGTAHFASEPAIRFYVEKDSIAHLRAPCAFAQDDFTPILHDTWDSAYWSAQTALSGAEQILQGLQSCYAICRPPGHHAGVGTFGGFCFLNNAAIAARFLSPHGRVAILDIDAHHGQGTQEIFYSDPSVLYLSLHGDPTTCYPFSGKVEEKGVGAGIGSNCNFLLPEGVGDDHYCQVLADALACIRNADPKPKYLILSLGFDLCGGDPYARFNITRDGLVRIARLIAELQLPTLLVQEGGYNLEKLEGHVHAFMRAFADAHTGGARYKT